jgi:hypothetical protein
MSVFTTGIVFNLVFGLMPVQAVNSFRLLGLGGFVGSGHLAPFFPSTSISS